jgi:hypothetical protein
MSHGDPREIDSVEALTGAQLCAGAGTQLPKLIPGTRRDGFETHVLTEFKGSHATDQ